MHSHVECKAIVSGRHKGSFIRLSVTYFINLYSRPHVILNSHKKVIYILEGDSEIYNTENLHELWNFFELISFWLKSVKFIL